MNVCRHYVVQTNGLASVSGRSNRDSFALILTSWPISLSWLLHPLDDELTSHVIHVNMGGLSEISEETA